MQSIQMKTIVCKAAVVYETKGPCSIEEIQVTAPKQDQIRVKIISIALSHNDIFKLDKAMSLNQFPFIFGCRATGIVESVGKNVTAICVNDSVIFDCTNKCSSQICLYCGRGKSNFCPNLSSSQLNSFMADETSHFKTKQQKKLSSFMNYSTFSQYTVVSKEKITKISKNIDLSKISMILPQLVKAWEEVMNNQKVVHGSIICVWGLHLVGFSIIHAAKIKGIKKIFALDFTENNFQLAKQFGAYSCFKMNSIKEGKQWLVQQQKCGIDFSYDCRETYNSKNKNKQSDKVQINQFVVDKMWKGRQIYFQEFSGQQNITRLSFTSEQNSKQNILKYTNKFCLNQLNMDGYCSNKYKGIESINEAILQLSNNPSSLVNVIKISQSYQWKSIQQLKVVSSVKLEQGVLKTISHLSKCNNTLMTFNIYIPDYDYQSKQQIYPALYFLAGLTANFENAPVKSGFSKLAKKYKMAVVFPDTCPRNTGIKNIADDWEVGESASYYINATSQIYKQYFQMFTYINHELPDIVSQYFPVCRQNISITGFSMGGHGALTSALKTGQFKSVSAFAPMANPTKSESWGQKAFKMFFKNPEEQGKLNDATQIIRSGKFNKTPTFIDIGTQDQYQDKLLFNNLKDQLFESKYPHIWKQRSGYNHSFYFVSTFLEEHFEFHFKYLNTF